MAAATVRVHEVCGVQRMTKIALRRRPRPRHPTLHLLESHLLAACETGPRSGIEASPGKQVQAAVAPSTAEAG